MTGQTSLGFGTLATLWLTLSSLGNANPTPPTVTVKYPQLIQPAINAAQPGTTIIVKSGTYSEQLTIKKDGITLVGQKGTILKPPQYPIYNKCSGTAGEGSIAGICVVSKDIIIDPFPGEEHSKVSHPNFTPVKGVTIKGFEIHGFSGQNIVLYGAKDASISNNKLIDGGAYGFLTVASKNTDVRGNTITSSSLFSLIGISIGACSDNYYGATVWANDFDGYGISICVQTNGANIQHNHITNSCLSVFVDPGIEGAIIRHNKISSANPICAPAIGVITGISLAGASKTQVEHNDITGQTAGDAAPPGFKGNGISIFDWPEGQAIPAAYNEIFRNDLSYNDQDLALLTAAPGNVFKKNDCVSSTPPGLCSL